MVRNKPTLNLFSSISQLTLSDLCELTTISIFFTYGAFMASIPLSSINLASGRTSSWPPCFSLNCSWKISSNNVGCNMYTSNSFSIVVKPLKRNRRVKRDFVCRAAAVVFRNLDADDFRHPLDRQVTAMLFPILLTLFS